MRTLACIAALICLPLGAALAEPPPRSERAPPSAGPDTGPAPFWATGWKPEYKVPSHWTPRYFHYETRYTASVVDKKLIFRSYADGTASWIARELKFDLKANPDQCLNWRWSADTLPMLKDKETTLKGDDFAARVYLFGQFENGDAFGFNYVWSTEQPPGTSWTSPWSTNKLMALKRGANTGDLLPESRRISDDIEAAYGMKPVRISSIALMTDAEGSNSVAAARISLPAFGACEALVS